MITEKRHGAQNLVLFDCLSTCWPRYFCMVVFKARNRLEGQQQTEINNLLCPFSSWVANFSLSGFPQLLLGLHSKLDFITMQDPHFQHQILSSSLSFCSLHTEFVVLVLRQKYSSEESPKSPPRVSNLLLNHRTKNAQFPCFEKWVLNWLPKEVYSDIRR